jgi:ligand-binding sensor domain-containing protein
MLNSAAKRKVRGLVVLAFLLTARSLFSASELPPHYVIRTWQVEQGLPQNKVTAVVQTRDGYLWAGTYNGLARFDGIRFTVFDDNNTQALHSRRVTSLFEADDGTLWIGTENGDVAKFRNGRFEAVPMQAAWRGGKIYGITADESGDVWLLNEMGELARVRDGKVLSPPSGLAQQALSFARATDGTVWINREGIVSSLRNGQLTTELGTNNYVQGPLEISIRLATKFQPQGALTRSAAHFPFFHRRMVPLLATQKPPSRVERGRSAIGQVRRRPCRTTSIPSRPVQSRARRPQLR